MKKKKKNTSCIKKHMYCIYAKTDRVICVIGEYALFDKNYIVIKRDGQTVARFMMNSIEGYVIKEIDE